MSARDTIAALASPPGPGERGVVRLSGARVAELLPRLLRDSGGHDLEPPARGAHAARLFDGRGEQPCLLLWMPGPRSYTREDVAELHLPGAPPLLARALARCLELGARSARPGEFTPRAFPKDRFNIRPA